MSAEYFLFSTISGKTGTEGTALVFTLTAMVNGSTDSYESSPHRVINSVRILDMPTLPVRI